MMMMSSLEREKKEVIPFLLFLLFQAGIKRETKRDSSSKMRRSFRVRILWVAIVVGIQAPFHFPLTLATDSSEPQGRNAQWLEDQIDTFLTAAQNNGDPTDIQVSSCKISGQQLVATAQATIARVLKGVCDPSKLYIFPFNLG